MLTRAQRITCVSKRWSCVCHDVAFPHDEEEEEFTRIQYSIPLTSCQEEPPAAGPRACATVWLIVFINLEGRSDRDFSGCPYADTTPGFLALRVTAELPQGLNGFIRSSGDAFIAPTASRHRPMDETSHQNDLPTYDMRNLKTPLDVRLNPCATGPSGILRESI